MRFGRKTVIAVLVGFTVFMVSGCGSQPSESVASVEDVSEEPIEYSEYDWPRSDIATLIPIPESKLGLITWETSDAFYIDVADTSYDSYSDYIDACWDNGFNIDYIKNSDYFSANHVDGYHLSLSHNNNVMIIGLEKLAEPSLTPSENPTKDVSDEPPSVVESSEEPSESPSDELVDGLRPEFKEAMDSYETFMNEYVEFMNEYNSSDDTASMLADYSEFMLKMSDMTSKMEEWDEETMNDEETEYYTQVSLRVLTKLAEIQY